MFVGVRESFQRVNFSAEKIDCIFSVIGAILNLGNITFDDLSLSDNNPCTIKSAENLASCADLLKITKESLTKVLIYKIREIGK